jgi:hypothetical protein
MVLFHLNDRGEVAFQKIIRVIRRGSEMNDPNLFLDEIREFHDTRAHKGIVNGLSFLKSNLVFINDNKDIGQRLDTYGEMMQLIPVKDTIAVFSGEARSRLFHPIDRRESGNDKGVIVWDLLNGAQHGPGFPGLG